MAIESVAIVGMGAMGLLLGSQILPKMATDKLRVVADAGRIKKYENDLFTANGTALNFQFVAPEQIMDPVDLAIFAVKYGDLPQAINDMRNQIDGHTTIISVLNGIASEVDLAKVFSEEQVLYTVAQGMDATRINRRLTYSRRGELAVGAAFASQADRLAELQAFFDEMDIAYVNVPDIRKQIWSKFMFNTGINQVVGVYGGGYGVVQKKGEARSRMIMAMREVLPIARAEGIDLSEADVDNWIVVADQMGPDGKPSMLQDIEAGRPSEVGLFSGTVRQLAKKHGMAVPINDWLYKILTQKNAKV